MTVEHIMQIAAVLFPRVTALDIVGPYETLRAAASKCGRRQA